MQVLHRISTTGLLVLAGILLVLAGCGPKGRAVVKGQVMFFDKKLTAGTVAFHSADGRIGSGNIDFTGNYMVPDAPIGPCTVTVRVPTVTQKPTGAQAQGFGKPPKGLPPMRSPSGEDAGPQEADSTMIDPSKIVQIPGKYAKPESSGLTYTVERGENNWNITLSP